MEFIQGTTWNSSDNMEFIWGDNMAVSWRRMRQLSAVHHDRYLKDSRVVMSGSIWQLLDKQLDSYVGDKMAVIL